ncbi:TetR/AcrR family transcriptional regulator [Roseomonas chloroacetimidivorans]|jgi:AcrR family transcriptional regulator|uniref:TetR/AcrR family transcriptional regulator n=1 Tax=Roseomonas chloroacetimidivorans TaxID=1766656 RepID=UPI003C76ED90
MDQHVTDEAGLGREERAEASEVLARILSAAEAAFTAEGFHVATMDGIARRAGCSKKTIYKLFASKEELFFGLLERAKDEVCQVGIDRSKAPDAALVEFLEESGRFILRDNAVAVLRMLMAEYTHSPALLEAAERRGAGTARLALEGYLEELERKGGHVFGDAGEAARMLMGMALGSFHHEMLIGVTAAIAPEALRRRIRHAVGIFLRGTSRHGEAVA